MRSALAGRNTHGLPEDLEAAARRHPRAGVVQQQRFAELTGNDDERSGGTGSGAGDPSRCASSPWMQSGIAPDQRARYLVAALTLDQKIAQLHGEMQPEDFRIVPGIVDLCVPDLTVTNGLPGSDRVSND
jgi:hypothetical protein